MNRIKSNKKKRARATMTRECSKMSFVSWSFSFCYMSMCSSACHALGCNIICFLLWAVVKTTALSDGRTDSLVLWKWLTSPNLINSFHYFKWDWKFLPSFETFIFLLTLGMQSLSQSKWIFCRRGATFAHFTPWHCNLSIKASLQNLLVPKKERILDSKLYWQTILAF